jgi:hypothetical protein
LLSRINANVGYYVAREMNSCIGVQKIPGNATVPIVIDDLLTWIAAKLRSSDTAAAVALENRK